ncbi:MAG: hypothetical protein LBE09_04885, partial [Christensenellaceae bacterium]|nr:hypothetical protein [Christensenellaceae bacterium]
MTTYLKTKQVLPILICLLMVVTMMLISIIVGHGFVAHSEDDEVLATSITVASSNIPLQAYVLDDNTGYYISPDKMVSNDSHPFLNNYINLSLTTTAENSTANIDNGTVANLQAYGVTGSTVAVYLKYNFESTSNIYGRTELGEPRYFSVSNDTFRSVGEFHDIGVIGAGAMLIQKSYDGEDWTWQTKDGETKTNLHAFDFANVVNPAQYNTATGESYRLYMPSGDDLLKGVYIKLTFAYEVMWQNERVVGKKTYTDTYYYNIIEQATFYLVQNSGEILFHNVSTFDRVGEDDESGALSADNFETILSGDATLNGFRLDTLGCEAYTITYKYNGMYYGIATDGQYFLIHGRYDFTVTRKIGDPKYYTIFVDRHEVNDAAIIYFGEGLFTHDSQRIYTTGEYPTYIAGRAVWNLNATDGTILPVTGKLFRIVEDETEPYEILVTNISQSFSLDRESSSYYKTNILQGAITEPGIYRAEFWSNPNYTDEGGVSGDLYHFVFRFEVVSSDTPTVPSVNEVYLNNLVGFSDLNSKYFGVAISTSGSGNAIFAFADYNTAYGFAYEIERTKITVVNGKYNYKGLEYASQNAVLDAIDKIICDEDNPLVFIDYFDATNPKSYQTADILDEDILSMNFDCDIIVFFNDEEQNNAKSDDLPSLNGRKYRYISPDTGEIEEGILEFAFIKLDDFESKEITLTHSETGVVYSMLYGVSVEYQLKLENAESGVYIVHEINGYGDYSEYQVVYIRQGDMTATVALEMFRNGIITEEEITQLQLNTLYAQGFVLKSLENALDPQSIIKITFNNYTTIHSFPDVSNMWFGESGNYKFQVIDRLGNNFEFEVVID